MFTLPYNLYASTGSSPETLFTLWAEPISSKSLHYWELHIKMALWFFHPNNAGFDLRIEKFLF